MSKISLSVIIVAYKKIDILRDCLDSLMHYNDIGDRLEVIVVDNSEGDELYRTIKSEYAWVKIIKNENNGFGAGNNRGFEVSNGKYLLFLNPDTILIESIFQFVLDQFDKDPQLALFGVKLLDKNHKKKNSYFMIDRYSFFAAQTEKLCRMLNLYLDGGLFIAGADLFVRRDSFVQAGKFDENIFMYLEEPDLIKRIKIYAEAKKTKYFKEKRIVHLEGGTEDYSDVQVINMHKRLIASETYYSKKWTLGRKPLKERYSYQKFKLFVYRILFKKRAAQLQQRIVELYREALRNSQ